MTATFGLIRFSGDKTLSVIQGQCTQMVTNLTEGSSPLLLFVILRDGCMVRPFGNPSEYSEYDNADRPVRDDAQKIKAFYGAIAYLSK